MKTELIEALTQITNYLTNINSRVYENGSHNTDSDKRAYKYLAKIDDCISKLKLQDELPDLVTLEDAQKIPRHPKHTWEAVDSNGDYCRFINEPELRFGKCWVGDSIYSPHSGDAICKTVLLELDWKTTKRFIGDSK